MQDSELKIEAGEIVSVSSVSLQGFRNYAWLDIQLDPRFNVLSGLNGQGKTNFLEGLYLLSTTRLLRGQRDAEAIRDGEDRFTVSAELAPSRTRVSMTLERGLRKRALLNGVSLPRAADLIGRLPCISVSASDMEIVRGEPADRRLFLDLELSAIYPAYLRHLSHYKRALEQRNALLKLARENAVMDRQFEPWEQHLAEHGAAIREIRQAYVEALGPGTVELHHQMSRGEVVAIRYDPKDDGSEPALLTRALESTRGLDISRGVTQIGPHRDDVRIEVVGRDARLYGSQGQQRTAVIALKLASLQYARESLGRAPLLLLDDILSDLDEYRRGLLIEAVLDNAGQVVLTCTEASAAGPQILNLARVFAVEDGRIS